MNVQVRFSQWEKYLTVFLESEDKDFQNFANNRKLTFHSSKRKKESIEKDFEEFKNSPKVLGFKNRILSEFQEWKKKNDDFNKKEEIRDKVRGVNFNLLIEEIKISTLSSEESKKIAIDFEEKQKIKKFLNSQIDEINKDLDKKEKELTPLIVEILREALKVDSSNDEIIKEAFESQRKDPWPFGRY